MHKPILLLFASFLFLYACGQTPSPLKNNTYATQEPSKNQTQPPLTKENTIIARFSPPKKFERPATDSVSFSQHLRNLPLKEPRSQVSFFNGKTKYNNNIYAAVVDLPIGKRDLHQCADAVIRLRADYFFQHKKYDSIHFNFSNGFTADYTNWRKGKRIMVKGNSVTWKQSTTASDSAKSYWKYLEMVFSYAGTASLEKEMKSISLNNLRIGDVFIKGGFPGHAVIVVDLAIHETTHEKVFLLAQSYMPAQEIQILKNPNNSDFSPWYRISEIDSELRTPEWTFKRSALRRFTN